MYTDAVTKTTKESILLKNQMQSLKGRIKETIDRMEQMKIISDAKKIRMAYELLKKENEISKGLLAEYKPMKNIDTDEEFRKLIQTCDFWADTWAISTLERALNIKFIILSLDKYNQNDIHNVLVCNTNVIDPILQSRGEFIPEFYIIIEQGGRRFNLVEYRKKQIFTFAELPYDLKKMIVNKCMENDSGVFALIPDFIALKGRRRLSKKEILRSTFDDIGEAKMMNLFNDGIVFAIHNNAADQPLPGRGAGEKISHEETVSFAELASIPKWRKMMDDTWSEHPFTFDNHRWASVEHCYQANKFKKHSPEFYLSFSLEGGTKMSKDVEMAVAAGSKNGKYEGELIRPSSVKVDPDYHKENRSDKVRSAAQKAKIEQNIDLRAILELTKNAKLIHTIKGKPPKTLDNLMIIRDKMRKLEV